METMYERLHDLQEENERLKIWVADLQSGMYINCVYCGHRYGPEDEVPASMADVLKQHIEECPEHPMSKLKAKVDRLVRILKKNGPSDPDDWCYNGCGHCGCDRCLDYEEYRQLINELS